MSITVGLVDERVLLRKGLRELLTSFGGIEVQEEADNATILIKRLRKNAQVLDLCIVIPSSFILSNIQMIREIRKKFRSTKILVIAPYADSSIVKRLFAVKVNGLLLSNSEPEDLKDAVYKIYRGDAVWPILGDVKISPAGEKIDYPLTRLSLPAKYIQFLKLCLHDLTYNEISEQMGLTLRAVEGYRDNLFRKFKVKSKTALVLFALKNGLLELR
ncbi:LuxR C-terminal-related transcriptional regulator [Mucilaginibacter sp.]